MVYEVSIIDDRFEKPVWVKTFEYSWMAEKLAQGLEESLDSGVHKVKLKEIPVSKEQLSNEDFNAVVGYAKYKYLADYI